MIDPFKGPVAHILTEAGVQPSIDTELYHTGVRGDPNMRVFRCPEWGVIYLDDIKATKNPYEKRISIEKSAISEDNRRRTLELETKIKGAIWADVGAGAGGLLQQLHVHAKYAVGVEPIDSCRVSYPCSARESIDQLEDNYYDVITLMHTLEHLSDPIEMLTTLRRKLKSGGSIFIEVPYAKDFLLENSPAFRSFSLWTEHLILHTQNSLNAFLLNSGFSTISITCIQRYSVANHLHWLAKGAPNGHVIWKHLDTPRLNAEYSKALIKIYQSDTLWAVATK